MAAWLARLGATHQASNEYTKCRVLSESYACRIAELMDVSSRPGLDEIEATALFFQFWPTAVAICTRSGSGIRIIRNFQPRIQ